MRVLYLSILLGVMMSGCKVKTQENEINDVVEDQIDSTTVAIVPSDLLVEEEEKETRRIDESFIDFIYSFTRNEKIQASRINFPLPNYALNEKILIDKENWQFDPLFTRMDTYTNIYESNSELEIEEDTSATSAQLEWIFLKEKKIRRYYFERIEGLWKLEAIDNAAILKEEPSSSEDFFTFYERFANDSVFQLQRTSNPLKFVTYDPDDEFSILETTLDAGQFMAFSPTLPKDTLTNVNYGQNTLSHSNVMIIEMKGNGNGFSNTFYFKRRNGLWKLTQYDDLSD